MRQARPYLQRCALRLPTYDYSQAGAYLMTLCTHRRLPLLGTISEGVMTLSPAGRIVGEEWVRTPTLRPHVTLDGYVIMPNHVHGILFLQEGTTEDRAAVGENRIRPHSCIVLTPSPGHREGMCLCRAVEVEILTFGDCPHPDEAGATS